MPVRDIVLVAVTEPVPDCVTVFEGDRDPVCDEVPVFVTVLVAVLEPVTEVVTVFVDVADETTSVVGVTDTDAVLLVVDVVDFELV